MIHYIKTCQLSAVPRFGLQNVVPTYRLNVTFLPISYVKWHYNIG